MGTIRKWILACVVFVSCASLCAEGKMAQANGLDIWYETFGEKTDPTVLLIMGSGGQGILWPTALCEKLASKHFYVIRYDNRDTGLSSTIDYAKNPYDLKDMAKDALGLLDHLKIKKAHVFGGSMGGAIAQLIAAHHPERALTATLMVTSCDFAPCIAAFEGKSLNSKLSPPTEKYTKWVHSLSQQKPDATPEQYVEQMLVGGELANGSEIPFEKELCRELWTLSLKRQRSPASLGNHIMAMKASLKQISSAGPLIKAPTLIIQGTCDPIFPIDHGEALAASIKGSKLVVLKGQGHTPNTHFSDTIIDHFVNLTKGK